MIEPADNLFDRIQNISDEGLPDVVPYKPAFVSLMEALLVMTQLCLWWNLCLLPNTLLCLCKKVWEDLDEKQTLVMDWFLPRKKITRKQLLDSMLSSNNLLENSPVFKQYSLLKDYLKKYNLIKFDKILQDGVKVLSNV